MLPIGLPAPPGPGRSLAHVSQGPAGSALPGPLAPEVCVLYLTNWALLRIPTLLSFVSASLFLKASHTFDPTHSCEVVLSNIWWEAFKWGWTSESNAHGPGMCSSVWWDPPGNGGTVPGDLVNGREWGSHRPPSWMFSNQAREEGL